MATTSPDVVQVSMNLLDTERTPLHVAYEAVRSLAAERRVEVAASEVVGLVPQSVLVATFRHCVKASGFDKGQVLELRLLDALGATGQPPG